MGSEKVGHMLPMRLLDKLLEPKDIGSCNIPRLRKAFDAVPHVHLISKARTMGSTDRLLFRRSSYLKNEMFCMKMESTLIRVSRHQEFHDEQS